ncbi:MAG TPA: hypothetical protein VF268_05685 [Gammaproteobacteria bacterium]
MLGLFKNRQDESTRVGIHVQPEGLALAVKTRNAGADRVKCDFVALDKGKDAGEALKTLVGKHRLQGKSAVFLLPQHHYSLLQTSSPPMPRQDLRAAARWKIGDLISFPVEQAVVDVFDYPESGQRGTDRMLYVVAARADQVRNEVMRARDAGLDLRAIDISELALRNVVSRLEENQAGAMVLSLSEHSGLLVLIKQDEVYLARRLEIGFAELEAAGQNMLDDVVLELQRSLDYFESQFAQPLPAKLLIYPPDKVSGELMMHIHSHMNLEVEPLILEKIPGFIFDNDEESQSRCLLAVGAALRDDDEATA